MIRQQTRQHLSWRYAAQSSGVNDVLVEGHDFLCCAERYRSQVENFVLVAIGSLRAPQRVI
jgi:hypothetical protein